MRLAGHVFDQYDDVGGEVLRTVAPTLNDIPDFVKTAASLTSEQRMRLPDDQYALIMIDEGRKMRKYATINPAQTALSVVYLLKQAHLLPPQAVKAAASNLVAACLQHGIDVPENLKIAAKSGVSPVSGKSQKPYKSQQVSHLNFPTSEPEKQTTENPQLGNADGANDDVDQRTNMAGVQGTNFVKIPPFSQKEHEKTASDRTYSTKQQQWKTSPYVDMSGWDPSAANYGIPSSPARETLIEGHYPIDGYDQVKTASAYFVENWREFEPRKRHEYCVKLAQKMEKLGMAIPDDVARYGSETYAADCTSYVEARRSWVADEFKPALDVLLEKRAQVSPGTFAEALTEFDNITGLRYQWDVGVADSYYSTFGPSREKLAEENWRYDEGGTRCTEDDLKALATNGHEQVKKAFGGDFAKEFAKSPKSVFNSLPAPNKQVLARMASDRSGAGETV